MNWSLNELEALSKKAARGIGLDWGLAEETGKATRWLCAAGWPAADTLAALLSRNDGLGYDTLRPRDLETPWTASGGLLCPLISGALISDLAQNWADGTAAELGATAFPVMLLPYMAWAADGTGTPLELCWPGVRITRINGQTHVSGEDAAVLVDRTAHVRVQKTSHAADRRVRRGYRAEVSQAAANVLNSYAQRTYAPETEQSRLSGAGAGLNDND